ncbi:MAG: PQ-loop domain-containing transporter [Actinomycetota bacterium]
MSPTNLLGLVASTLSMLFIWPQVFRVYRNDTVEGLAPLGALQGMSGSILWSIYGLSQSDMPLFGSNLLLSIAIALLGIAMMRHGVLSRGTLVGVIVGVLGTGLVATAISTSVVGILAFAIGASSVLPQTFKVLRDPDLDGVSVSSNSLLFVTSSAWLTYGLAISDTLVWLPNLLVIPCSALIVAKARASQRRTANVPAHAA